MNYEKFNSLDNIIYRECLKFNNQEYRDSFYENGEEPKISNTLISILDHINYNGKEVKIKKLKIKKGLSIIKELNGYYLQCIYYSDNIIVKLFNKDDLRLMLEY